MSRDFAVAAAVQPDGGLYDLGWYLGWTPGYAEATLDGKFTAQDLHEIAEHMDRINKQKESENGKRSDKL